jgi:hypothetical protein
MGTRAHPAQYLSTHKSPYKQLIKRGKAVARDKAVAEVVK